MASKVKFEFDISGLRLLTKKIRQVKGRPVKSATLQRIANSIVKSILFEVARGRSPVSGQGKYKAYSKSYKKQIESGALGNKSVRPVNLKLSGDMLRSLTARVRRDAILIFFRSTEMQKRAEYNEDNDRQVLPDENQKLKRQIQKLVESLLRKEIERQLKKL